jgi:hypothetical protein
MKNENLNKQETANSDLGAVRRSILGALNGAKKNCLALKNTPHIDSREYALAHGKLEGINKAIDIVKKYYTQL